MNDRIVFFVTFPLLVFRTITEPCASWADESKPRWGGRHRLLKMRFSVGPPKNERPFVNFEPQMGNSSLETPGQNQLATARRERGSFIKRSATARLTPS